MNENNRRRWLIASIVAAVLLLAAAVLLLSRSCGKGTIVSPATTPMAYVPGEYPEGIDFAELVTEEGLSEEARYAAYDPANDPAHPVLDVRVELSISNLGSRPGEPRPQDIAHEYPSPTPSPTPLPASTIVPLLTHSGADHYTDAGADSSIRPFPYRAAAADLSFYIRTRCSKPSICGGKLQVGVEYTGDIETAFAFLSVRTAAGVLGLATGIEGEEYEVTFSRFALWRCVLRVTMA